MTINMKTTPLENLLTPPGFAHQPARLVMGSLTEAATKDHEGNVLPPDSPAKYFFGVAIPKGSPGLKELIDSLWTMAMTDYAAFPQVVAQLNLGLGGSFKFKLQDGDAVTYDNKTHMVRPIPDYLKGCMVIKFSSRRPISLAFDANGQQMDVADIKRGDYVDVVFSAVVNKLLDANAGVYLNPQAVKRTGIGAPIGTGGGISADEAAAVFGSRAALNMTVSAGTGMPGVGNGGAPVGGVTAPVNGMPGAGTPIVGQMPTASPSSVVPHTGILQGPGAGGGGMPGM